MTNPLQAYNNLLTMCSTLWGQIIESPVLEPVTTNMQRAIKALAELGANLATTTTTANLTTLQLKECKTFLEFQVDSLFKATLCFSLGTILMGIGIARNNVPANKQTQRQIYISRAINFTALALFLYGTYRTANVCHSSLQLLKNIEKLPAQMNETIKQVDAMKNAFLVDGLYKTF